jgi:outer membrane protein TolC
MDDAVRMALEANLGLRSARIDLDRADQQIAGARAAFLPNLSASFNRRSSLQPPYGIFQTTDYSDINLTTNTTISQTLSFYGGSYSASWGTGRLTTSELFPPFNPSLSSSLNLSFTQPLWRNLRIDGLRAGIETSVRSRSIADLNVESQVIGMEVRVKNAYLNLVAAMESLNVAELNLKTSQDALNAARARVDVGVSPQLEIINQEVNVLSNREVVLAAQQNIQTAEDALRQLILDPARPDYWALRLEPAEQVRVPEQPSINLQQAIDNALANRIDVRILQLQLENTDFALRVSKNSTLPLLNLNLSYNANGNAGVLWLTDQETLERSVVSNTSFSRAFLDSFGGGYPTWSVGASFQYPLGRNANIANHTSNQLAKRQQEYSLQQLQLGVITDVRAAARTLESSFQRFEVLKARLEAAAKQEEAEQKKYSVGLSSTLDLQNVQNQLTAARTAELNARIAYMRALIAFESVQRINQ